MKRAGAPYRLYEIETVRRDPLKRSRRMDATLGH